LLAVIGVLVVVACGALGAEVAARIDHRAGYLAVATYVPQGSVIVPSDLATVRMTSTAGVSAIPSAEKPSVVGLRASEPLEPGSLLVPDDLSGSLPLPVDDALVGASLSTDEAPDGLAPGDAVIVVLTDPGSDAVSPSSPAGGTASGTSPSSTSAGSTGAATSGADSGTGTGIGPVSTASAGTSSAGGGVALGTVYAIVLPSASDQAGSSDNEIVTLEVPKSDAAAVTAASASGDVSLAEISTKKPS
jgi:Flp pilus assembly protein CpaB